MIQKYWIILSQREEPGGKDEYRRRVPCAAAVFIGRPAGNLQSAIIIDLLVAAVEGEVAGMGMKWLTIVCPGSAEPAALSFKPLFMGKCLDDIDLARI